MKLKNITDLPYYNTPASERKSEMEIERVLKKYGINNLRWTTIGDKKLLEFIHQPVKNEPQLHVKIPIPEVKALHNRRVTEVPMRQRMRMILHFVKSMLEATHFGLYKMEQVFFGFVQLQLPNGTEISAPDLLSHYENGRLLLETAPKNTSQT